MQRWRPFCRAAIAGAVLGLAAMPASAGPEVPLGREGDLARIVPPIHGRGACYARTYDTAHLKRHPQQKVTAFLLRIRYYFPETRYKYSQPFYRYELNARIRGRKETLSVSGDCVHEDATIRCGVECDGGGFRLELEPGTDAAALRMSIDQRLRVTGCGEEDDVELTPGTDDKLFRLQKVSDAACRPLDSLGEQDQ